MANDFVSGQLTKEYPGVSVRVVEFGAQENGLEALVRGEVDGFVISGGASCGDSFVGGDDDRAYRADTALGAVDQGVDGLAGSDQVVKSVP